MLSWNATGLLIQHWGTVGGRDELARLTGIEPTTLSSYNTGKRKLGIRNAERIAQALGVSVFDLGAPTAEQVAARAATLLDRVEALEADLAELRRRQGGEE